MGMDEYEEHFLQVCTRMDQTFAGKMRMGASLQE
jgi:hypothetical protein